jgi:hypothetical protein
MTKGSYFKYKDIIVQYTGRVNTDYHKGSYEDTFEVIYGDTKRRTLYEDEIEYNLLEPIAKETAELLYAKKT